MANIAIKYPELKRDKSKYAYLDQLALTPETVKTRAGDARPRHQGPV